MTVEARMRVSAEGATAATGQVDKLGRSVAGLGKQGEQATRKLKAGFNSVEQKFKGLLGLMVAGGVVAGTKRILDYGDALGQLQADAGKTTDEMRAIDKQLRKTAVTWNVNRDAALKALQVYQDSGSKMDAGLSTFERLAKVSKAATTPMDALAQIHADLMNTFQMSPTEGMETIEMFTKQAQAGTLALRDMAGVLPQVLALRAKLAGGGKDSARSLGVLLQVGKQAKGTAPEARSALNMLVNEMVLKATAIEKIGKGTKAGGVKVWSDKTKKTINDPLEIMASIFQKSKGVLGGKKGLSKIFGAESGALVSALSGQFDYGTGTWKKGSTVANVQGAESGQSIDAMYQKRVGGIGAESQQAQAAMNNLDDTMQEHGSKIVKWVASNKVAAVAGGVTAATLWKVLPTFLGGVIGQMGKGSGGTGTGAVMGMAGVQRVFVVNMGGALGGGVGTGSGLPTAPSAPSATRGQQASAAIVGFSTGYAAGTIIDEFYKELLPGYASPRDASGKKTAQSLSGSFANNAFDLAQLFGLQPGSGQNWEGGRGRGAGQHAAFMADQFLGMRDRGVEQLTDRSGKVIGQLDESGIAAVIAKQTGLGSSPEVLQMLRKLVRATERQRILKFTGFLGLSDPTVDQGRGPAPGS